MRGFLWFIVGALVSGAVVAIHCSHTNALLSAEERAGVSEIAHVNIRCMREHKIALASYRKETDELRKTLGDIPCVRDYLSTIDRGE
jgi:hypothetical protein